MPTKKDQHKCLFPARKKAQWIKGASHQAEESPNWKSNRENQFLLVILWPLPVHHTHKQPTHDQSINKWKSMPVFRVQAQPMKCSLGKHGLSWDVQHLHKARNGDPSNREAEVPGAGWPWGFHDGSGWQRCLLHKPDDQGSVPRTKSRKS